MESEQIFIKSECLIEDEFIVEDASSLISKEDEQSNISENNQNRKKYATISIPQKELLIKLHSEGDTIINAARIAGINPKTAFHIIKRYEKDDYQFKVKKRKCNVEKKLTQNVLELIEKEIENNPEIKVSHINERLTSQNINMSSTTVDNGLKELKITLKSNNILESPIDVNTKEIIEERKEYAINFCQYVPSDGRKIIFVDECEFNLHMRKSKVKYPRYITIVAAMNNEGILHFKLILGGKCNSNEFQNFLVELKRKISDLNDCWLILDNNRKLTTDQIINLNFNSELQIKCLPSYSTILNPMKKGFIHIKTNIRNLLTESEETDLHILVNKAITKINKSDCSDWLFIMMRKMCLAAAGMELN